MNAAPDVFTTIREAFADIPITDPDVALVASWVDRVRGAPIAVTYGRDLQEALAGIRQTQAATLRLIKASHRAAQGAKRSGRSTPMSAHARQWIKWLRVVNATLAQCPVDPERKPNAGGAWHDYAPELITLLLSIKPKLGFASEKTAGSKLVSKLFGLAGQEVGPAAVATACAGLVSEFRGPKAARVISERP